MPTEHTAARRKAGFTGADLLGPLAVAAVVFVVFLWLRNQGLASLTETHRAVGSLGLLTGLLASILMVLQVVMMARIPAVERSWGHDLLARRHRLLGLWSFWLMVAHVVLYVVERLGRGGDPRATLLDLFLRDPWMLWASVGTLALVMVVVTSVRAARRRLRYETWHLLHLYAYLGMGFALPHQILDGADFHEPWARTFWWGVYVAAAVAVLVFRFALPVVRSLYHRVTVEQVTRETGDVFSVEMRGHRLDRLRTESGQFFVWRFRDGPGWTRGNPYTISAAPTPDRLRVTVRVAGDGSARQSRLRPGTRVWLEGPYGVMTARRRRHDHLLLIAAGVGITPFRAILEDAAFEPGEATLVYRYSGDEPVFRAELDELAARRGVTVHYLGGPRRAEGSWLPAGVPDGDDATVLTTLAPHVADSDVFVCGPSRWIKAVCASTTKAGAHRDQVHTEDFAW